MPTRANPADSVALLVTSAIVHAATLVIVLVETTTGHVEMATALLAMAIGRAATSRIDLVVTATARHETGTVHRARSATVHVEMAIALRVRSTIVRAAMMVTDLVVTSVREMSVLRVRVAISHS